MIHKITYYMRTLGSDVSRVEIYRVQSPAHQEDVLEIFFSDELSSTNPTYQHNQQETNAIQSKTTKANI
jgi:hypothetical protein